MSELLARVRAVLEGLAPRERILVAAAAAVVLLAVLFLGVVQPFLSAIDRSRERALQAERELELVQQLRRQLDEVGARLERVEGRIRKGPRENLRTTLDRLRTAAGIQKFDSIDERARKPSDGYQETQMEVVLKSVTLAQVVRYLHEIETAPQVLSVKRLRINTRSDQRDLLDVRFVVSSFDPA